MQKSTIPTSCVQIESTVLNKPVSVIWPQIRALLFAELCPEYFKSVETTGQVGSIAKINYSDGASTTVRITEISDRKHQISYESISSEPEANFSAQVSKINLSAITDTNQTMLTWTSEYSNDCDIQVI